MKGLPLMLGFCLAVCAAAGGVTGAHDAEGEPCDDYTVRCWTLDDGLPDSRLCGVAQSADGYLWLATAHDLVRFDGLRFTTVALPPQSFVGDNEGLFQDSRGGLWVYGFLGAVRYAEGGWWQSEEAGLPRGRVRAVTEGADGRVYIAQERALFAWREGVARRVLESASIPEQPQPFRSLARMPDGTLLLAVGDGLYRWRPGEASPTGRVTDIRAEWVLSADARRPPLAHGSFVCLRSGGDAWERLPEGRIVSARCVLPQGDGALWVGHDAGAVLFRDGVWRDVALNLQNSPVQVTAMTEDTEGNLWLATRAGLVRLRRRVFSEVPLPAATSEQAGVSVLWVESDGHAWAGLRAGGLAFGDSRGLRRLALPREMEGAAFSALYRQFDGTLWCGGAAGGLWAMSSQEVWRAEGVYTDSVRAIAGRGGPPSWVASSRGLLSVNAERRSLEELAWPTDPVLVLFLDRDGFLWVGHESLGLAALRSGARDEFQPEAFLPGATVRAIYRDSEGVLWIGGLAGLARWQESERFVFRRAHGLWNESVRQIAEDASGCLWLGTADGVMRIEKRELDAVAAGRKPLLGVRTFGVEAGLSEEACTGGVCFPQGEPPRDRLWFPMRSGLVTVGTRALPAARPAPEVRVCGLALGRLATRSASVPAAVGAALADADSPRDVCVEYAAVDLTVPERVRFLYELSGPVSQRSGLTCERSVRFSRLPPGDYTFRVTACNGDGVWHPAGATAAWRIRPFFWETSAFRYGCLLLGGAALVLAARVVERRRVARRLAAAERAEALSAERARIARDLHDEIGAKLTRLSLIGAMAVEDAGGDEALRREIEEMAGTARETHRAFDEIVWSVSPRNDTVRSLSHYICKYAEEFFAGSPVRCLCRLPDDMPDLTLDPLCRHAMFLSVKEGLNNVLRHAGAGQVTVSVRLADRRLRVGVEDDGCGFEPAEVVEKGEGLRNMRERLRSVGGEVTLVSSPGSGTRLTFEMSV